MDTTLFIPNSVFNVLSPFNKKKVPCIKPFSIHLELSFGFLTLPPFDKIAISTGHFCVLGIIGTITFILNDPFSSVVTCFKGSSILPVILFKLLFDSALSLSKLGFIKSLFGTYNKLLGFTSTVIPSNSAYFSSSSNNFWS